MAREPDAGEDTETEDTETEDTETEAERIAAGYRWFAGMEAASCSPRYARLATAVADHEEMLRFVAGPGRPAAGGPRPRAGRLHRGRPAHRGAALSPRCGAGGVRPAPP